MIPRQSGIRISCQETPRSITVISRRNYYMVWTLNFCQRCLPYIKAFLFFTECTHSLQGKKLLLNRGYLKDILTRLRYGLKSISFDEGDPLRSKDPMRQWMLEALYNILQDEDALKQVYILYQKRLWQNWLIRLKRHFIFPQSASIDIKL